MDNWVDADHPDAFDDVNLHSTTPTADSTGSRQQQQHPERYSDVDDDYREEKKIECFEIEGASLPTVEEIKAKAFFEREKEQQRQDEQVPQRIRFKAMLGVGALLLLSLICLIFVTLKRSQYNTAVASVTKYVRISHPDAFDDSKSPQSRALRWMLHHDPLRLPLPKEKSDPFVQRYIIAVLVFAVAPSSLHTKSHPFHFLSDQHECLWNSEWKRADNDHALESIKMGILCRRLDDNNDLRDEDVGDDRIVGIEHPPVTSIVMHSAGLQGELPRELESLTALQHVALDNNKIRGQVPVMPYLTHLSLSYNELTGYMPDHFSEMSRLETLSMAENALQGSLPKTLAALTNLELLALNGNQLTGGMAQIYPLSNLEEIYLAYNSFEDQLSNGSFQKLSNLKVLDMKSNRLSGPLPDALWNMTKLEVVDFHHNSLDGHINDVIRDDHPLKYLDISSNILGGGLPPSISNLRSLTHLDVSYNRFEALLPDYLANMTRMKTLLLTENDMLGPEPIPTWVRGMTDLQHLSFRLTARTGTLPTWFGELTRLQLLDLDWNHISGTIPTELGALTRLRYMMLNRNLMNGKVPSEVSSLPNLKFLMLDNNGFSGEVDACHVPFLITDCGDPELGCPDCDSDTQKIACPCCSSCCYDYAQRCNMEDWVVQVEDEFRSDFDQYGYSFDDVAYIPASMSN